MTDTEMRAAVALRMGDLAPDFEARTTKGPLRLSSLRGRWVVFFSHPADFTPVCTTEFVALAKAQPRFEALGCVLLGLSIDSLYSHMAWVRAIRELFGVAIDFPIVEDPSMAVGRAYGMLDEAARDSSGLRATYFIDPDGIIRAIIHYPMTVGRSVEEMLRLLAALQAAQGGDRLVPEGWQPGEPLLLLPAEDGGAADWFCRRAS
ncbi:MAG: peroxiredoxin [Sphingobium sp.]|uniref:peroxiredoxin n=1 Tax=unclassified Sphingobium TaxID=2611147 RepID=UPI0003D6473E|nr:peroxiredoxin [Sphingobium sp. C100]ETI65799.1 peroxiredoxin [Sphingobium sp. C100]